MEPATITKESCTAALVDCVSPMGTAIGSATGTLLRHGASPAFFVTNRHVVTGLHQDSGAILSSTGAVPQSLHAMIPLAHEIGQPGWIFCQFPLYGEDGTPRWVEHPVLGAMADVVALPLPGRFKESAPFTFDVQDRPFARVVPPDIVSVIGFPFGKTVGTFMAIWATGFVASEPSMDFEGLPIFLIDCRSRRGQSGAPVLFVHDRGPMLLVDGITRVEGTGRYTQFLGVYSGRINEQSDFGRVWKPTCLAELIRAAAERYPGPSQGG